ncbi:uncharacterized protein METZ01_LOCUS317465, partial [marine metagenome]
MLKAHQLIFLNIKFLFLYRLKFLSNLLISLFFDPFPLFEQILVLDPFLYQRSSLAT